MKYKNIIIFFMVLSLSGCGLDSSDAAAENNIDIITEINTEAATQENAENKKTAYKNNKPGIINTIAAYTIANIIWRSDEVQELVKNPEIAKNRKLYEKTSAREQCEIVMNAFKNRDNTTLKELFCDTIIQTHDLDTEFNEALEFINGNVVSYSEDSVDIAADSGGSSWDNGKLTEYYIDPWIKEVITDMGNEYWIGFCLEKVYEKDETKEGIWYIEIRDQSTQEEYTIGECF